jgi:DNA repair protein RecO
MQYQRDLAIVLRSIPYEDRHRIVSALTVENGQVRALAKNSIQSRRFGSSLELLTASDWTYTLKPSSELCVLTETQIRESFHPLRNEFGCFALASIFSELMLKLAPHYEACPDLFKLHANALATLSALASSIQQSPTLESKQVVLLNAYLVKILHWNGTKPKLHACLQCDMTLDQLSELSETLTCVIESAGWICPSCRAHNTSYLQNWVFRLTPTVIRDLQGYLCLSIRETLTHTHATHQEHQELFRFLEALFAYHLPGFDQIPLKGLRFLHLESNFQPAIKNLQSKLLDLPATGKLS